MSSRLELERQLKEHDKLDKWWDSLEIEDKQRIYDTSAIPATAKVTSQKGTTHAVGKEHTRSTSTTPPVDPFPMEAGSDKWPFKEEA